MCEMDERNEQLIVFENNLLVSSTSLSSFANEMQSKNWTFTKQDIDVDQYERENWDDLQATSIPATIVSLTLRSTILTVSLTASTGVFCWEAVTLKARVAVKVVRGAVRRRLRVMVKDDIWILWC